MLSGLADKRIFYGWCMVGAATGLQFLQAGLVTQAFGAYLAVLADEQGWSKTALSARPRFNRWKSRCSARCSAG